MSISLKPLATHFALNFFYLLSLHVVSLQVYALPVWRTAQIVAESKNMGCMHGCAFGHSNSNSSTFISTTSNQGEPFRFPEFSVGHLLVIPVAAIAALCYHVMKVKAGQPP